MVKYGNVAQRLSDKAWWFEAEGTINGTHGVYSVGMNSNGIIFIDVLSFSLFL